MPRAALKRAAQAVVRSNPKTYPAYIAPAQATNHGRPPSASGWAHEIKYDGYRSQVHVRDGSVTIYSKSGHDWTRRYCTVAETARPPELANK
jgi:bifunctional non-homologous end joining protein LigD